MQSFNLKALPLCALLSCFLAVFSCGKKAEKKDPGIEKTTPPQEVDFEAYLNKQSISCSDTSSCPTYISKIVVRHGPGVYKVCTGFLTDSETIVTSTNCLPEVLRLSGISCSQDVAFFFYERFSKGLRVGCKVVLQASEEHVKDPNLNRDDVAFLKLEKPLPYRRTLKISRDGLGTNRNTVLIGVEQSDDTNGEIKELDCPSMVGSYVNPLVTNESSPGFLLSGCEFVAGFSGAPVIDSRNKTRVRGVVSVGMDVKIRDYLKTTGLLTNGLRDFIHGSNFACAPTIYDNNVADEKECNKEISKLAVEKNRSNMLSSTNLFSEFRTRLESSLESGTKFVRFSLKLTPKPNPADPTKPNYDIQDVQVTPKCFKDVNEMYNSKYQVIENFKSPRRTYRKSMDEFGRIQSTELESAPFVTNLSWNPRDLRKNGKVTLYAWDPKTEITTETYTDLPICQ